MREFHNNSDTQVKAYVKKALALVDELEVPDDLRGACFVQALSLYASKQCALEPSDLNSGISVPASGSLLQ